MNIDTITAFVTGIAIPVAIALFGREALGRWLMSGQAREDTALSALIGIVQEAIAGWRESSTVTTQLIATLDAHKAEADSSRAAITSMLQNQEVTLSSLGERIADLIALLPGKPDD